MYSAALVLEVVALFRRCLLAVNDTVRREILVCRCSSKNYTDVFRPKSLEVISHNLTSEPAALLRINVFSNIFFINVSMSRLNCLNSNLMHLSGWYINSWCFDEWSVALLKDAFVCFGSSTEFVNSVVKSLFDMNLNLH